MTISPILRRDFYVYALFRADGITPFYIGKGRGKRMFIHEKNAHRFTSHKDNIIRSMLASGIREIPKTKLAEELLDSEALQIEMDLILLVGRRPRGPLVNLTKGGDGVSDLSPESVAKKVAANIASWADPAVKRKRVEGMKAVWTQDRRQAHRELKLAQNAKLSSEERVKFKQGAAASLAVRRAKAPPKREKKPQRAAIREFWADPEKRERVLAKRKATIAGLPPRTWNTDHIHSAESLAKSHATNRLPEVRERRIAAQKAAFSTPEAKSRRSEAAKKMWAAKKLQYALVFPVPQQPSSPE